MTPTQRVKKSGTKDADPIYDLILNYEQKLAKYGVVISNEPKGIPTKQCSWHADIYQPTPPENCQDHPDWIKYQLDMIRASDDAHKALVAVTETHPTTVLGIGALLDFIEKHKNSGMLCEEAFSGSFDAKGEPIYVNDLKYAYLTARDAAFVLGGES